DGTLYFRSILIITISLCVLPGPRSALAQAPKTTSPPSATAGLDPIRAYILHGWDDLSRSLTDCSTYTDSKLTTLPHLYLPYQFAVPMCSSRSKAAATSRCATCPPMPAASE